MTRREITWQKRDRVLWFESFESPSAPSTCNVVIKHFDFDEDNSRSRAFAQKKTEDHARVNAPRTHSLPASSGGKVHGEVQIARRAAEPSHGDMLVPRGSLLITLRHSRHRFCAASDPPTSRSLVKRLSCNTNTHTSPRWHTGTISAHI